MSKKGNRDKKRRMNTRRRRGGRKTIIVCDGKGEDRDGPSRRLTLIESNIQHIEAAYKHGKSQGIDDAVVFVLDVTDPLAKELHITLNRPPMEDFRRAVAQIVAAGHIPTNYAVLPRSSAIDILERVQLDLATKDRRNSSKSAIVDTIKITPTEGCFYVVAISGGKNLLTLPIP